MGLRGIKSRVFIQFWILLFGSMLLFYLLIMFLFLERTITNFAQQKKENLRITCNYLQRLSDPERATLLADYHFKHTGDQLYYIKTNEKGTAKEIATLGNRLIAGPIEQTFVSGKPVFTRAGRTFGLLFMQHESILLTLPVIQNGYVVAVAGLQSSISGIYQEYRQIQKIALVFIVINSFVFSLLGNRQLGRIYFRPLQRLAKKAEAYTDEESLFFAVRKEDNEFSMLSASLNKMLERIARDKQMLQETIGSLQDTNRELQQAQNDIIRAEKMASVGRLTAGIAHEIGNPIGIVLGYLDLMKQSDLSAEEHEDFIKRSEQEITRINAIIRQLLDMTRTADDEVSKPVAVHPLIKDLLSVFDYQPGAGEIQFESQLHAENDQVRVDPDRLRQVFLNILLNAVDAINSARPDDPRIVLQSDCTPDNGEKTAIRIRIADNGPGISPEDLPHVFDPFFTTKEPGNGTGLGLSVSIMIIEKMGGTMSVSSSKQAGTAFDIQLPLVDSHRERQAGPTTG